MIKEIMKDPIFLSQKSKPATIEDLSLAQDLLDTLEANKEGCVGMAANMIGISKRVIIFDDNGVYTVMFNPEIVRSSDRYETEEGCFSLPGTRKQNAGAPSKCNIKMRHFKQDSKHTQVGQRKSFNMKLITAMVS